MSAHTHSTVVPGCYRCELNADEVGIADEARAYAEKRWPVDRDWTHSENEAQFVAQEAFVAGAEWQASRKVEVTTVEELEALPVGSVVQSADYPAKNDFALYRKHALNLWMFTENSAVPTVKLPAIVLYRPAALGGGE